MKKTNVTGLGEPDLVGKKSLFQPPKDVESSELKNQHIGTKSFQQRSFRVRTTIGLTRKALVTIQKIQNQYRLETGKVLPVWQLVSDAIEYYGETNGEREKTENSPYPNPQPICGPTVKTTSRASLTQT